MSRAVAGLLYQRNLHGPFHAFALTKLGMAYISRSFAICMALQCAVSVALLWPSKSTKDGCEMLDPFLSQADVASLSNWGGQRS